ncbi:MAG TPA: tetratricopeptide repeat protein [Rhodothermales bacterium]|nr:tetratricopeptide repeat protein [Rhodothermales bacterium]
MLRKVSLLIRRGKKGTGAALSRSFPVLLQEEVSVLGIAMVFTAIGAVATYALEPMATSALLFTTLGLAVYTTTQPDTRAWGLYNEALEKPLGERIEILKNALRVAPTNDQIAFALGMSLGEAGRYPEAVEVLRNLSERRPDYTEVEAALTTATRTLLAQTSTAHAAAADTDSDLEGGSEAYVDFRYVVRQVNAFFGGKAHEAVKLILLGRIYQALEQKEITEEEADRLDDLLEGTGRKYKKALELAIFGEISKS